MAIFTKISAMFNRTLTPILKQKMGKGKAILLIGPRQVGKTTLIKMLLEKESFLFLDGDDPTVRNLLTQPNTAQIKSIIGRYKIIFIDEAQRIAGIGLTMKIITDQFKEVQLIVSGSSSFELNNAISEPLTGRKWEFELFPISWQELELHEGFLSSEQQLNNRLLYGFYPDVLNHPGEETAILKNLVNSYLYRDILSYSNIRKPEVLEKLVQALALQIGSEVNYNEIAQLIGVDKNTVNSYINILQQGYVIFKLKSFSRNLRNEIKKYNKIYFYDVGVRNMVIGNFSSLDLREDKGAIWENFLIAERIKQNTYNNKIANTYFWRTKQQQEIDFIEEANGELNAFEFKWNAKSGTKISDTFMKTYKASTHIIDRTNFREFVMTDF
jgi:hypothetical protein